MVWVGYVALHYKCFLPFATFHQTSMWQGQLFWTLFNFIFMKVHIVCIIQFYHQMNKMFGISSLLPTWLEITFFKRHWANVEFAHVPKTTIHEFLLLNWCFQHIFSKWAWSKDPSLCEKTNSSSQPQNSLLWNKSFHLHHVSRIW